MRLDIPPNEVKKLVLAAKCPKELHGDQDQIIVTTMSFACLSQADKTKFRRF
jgi:hypothetical protein